MVDIPAQLQRQMDELALYEQSLEGAPEGDTTAGSPPAAPPAAPPTPPATPPVAAPEAEVDWKQKYLTLQGMFNADVPRLNAQVRELTAELTKLKLDLAAKPTPATPPAPPKGSNPKDVEAFGADLLDVIERKAGDVVASAQAAWQAEKAQLETRIAELSKTSGSVAERQAVNDRQRYLADLKAQVPDLEVVNVNPEFLAWMAETDPLSGVVRQTHLETAYANFDVARTALLFNTWKAKQAPAPAPAATPAKTPAQQQLERQVAPSGSKAATPTTPPDASTKVWTTAEIDQFWKDVRRGVYRGKEAEATRVEAEIDAAVATGRVAS